VQLGISRLLRVRQYLDSPTDANDRGRRQAGPVPGSGVFGPWSLSEGATTYPVALFDRPEGHFYVQVGAQLKDDTQRLGWQSDRTGARVVGLPGLGGSHRRAFLLAPGGPPPHA